MKVLAENLDAASQARVSAAHSDVRPRVLPGEWSEVESYENATRYESRDGLRVILETEMVDGALWLHASMSRRDRIPSWRDLQRVKDTFIGADRKAIQVLPARSEYVNRHPYCLHLFSPLDTDPLPDFRCGGDL